MTQEEFYNWMDGLDIPQTFTDDLKEDIMDNVDSLVNHIKNNHNQFVMVKKQWLTEDAEGNEITKELDYEEMANDFEEKLSKFDTNVVVMCSIETRGTIN